MNSKDERNITFYKYLNLISLILVLVVNFLANYLPLNGYNTGELSDMYPNLFVPAGLTFSIWGVIYLLLTVFIISQFINFKNKEEIKEEIINKIGYLFFLTSLANAAWIFAWHYLYVFLSLIIMLVLLFSLILIYRKLEIGLTKYSEKLYYIFILPFSVYLGWITIATLANVTALLVDINLYGGFLKPVFWTNFVLLLGLIITLYILLKRKDIAYSIVVSWAYLGIIIKRYYQDPEPIMSIVYIAAICIIVIIISAVNITIKKA
ncbi:MAG: hypothetical protein R6V14_03295 [Halanaerobiales bacterium]